MSLTPQQIAEARKKIGFTAPTQNTGAANVARRRQMAAEYDAQQQKPKGYLQRVGESYKQGAENIISGVQKSAEQVATGLEEGGLKGAGNVAGGLLRGAMRPVGEVAKQAFTPIVEAPGVKQGLEGLGNLISKIPGAEFVAQKAIELSKENPELAKDLQNLLDVATLGLGKTVEQPIKAGIVKAGEKGTELAGQAVAKGTELASKGVEMVKPGIEATMDLTKSAGRAIGNLPSKIKTNVAEKQVALKAIDALPTPVAKKSASLGVDVADVNTILNIPEEIKLPVKNLYKAVKDYSTGASKVRPEEVVGKPITSALKNLDSMRGKVGQQLGEVAKNLGTVSQDELFTPVFDKLKNVISGLTIKNGKLNFNNTVLTTAETRADRKAIQSIFEQATRWGSGEKKHKLRQELFEILGGKKKSLTNITATQEKAYEAIRQGLSDVLDTKNSAYKTLNTEYAKIIEPLRDLRKMMKGIVGADEDILDMSAGLLARRLTSNAPSNPQLRSILKKIDVILKENGNTLTNLEGLQDVYNVLDKYYDIAAKTGFQGQIKSAMIPKAGDLTSRAFDALTGFAGETPAVRQKALENLLDDVLKNPNQINLD